uniref:ZAD domain-containing protein n=1 Tax=Anopheles culicifacies TaxID=139723 RepID=A0A182M710_9DIPT
MSVPNVPICRICLSNDELQVSLFSEYAQRKLLLTKIRVCLPITITHADTLPVTICSQCIIRLEQFYEYYCKSETSQRILTAGNGNLGALSHRKTLPESYQLNTTLTVNEDPPGMCARACLVSEQGDHGSIAITDQMDPILTQSPQVKRPLVTQGVSIATMGLTVSHYIQFIRSTGTKPSDFDVSPSNIKLFAARIERQKQT